MQYQAFRLPLARKNGPTVASGNRQTYFLNQIGPWKQPGTAPRQALGRRLVFAGAAAQLLSGGTALCRYVPAHDSIHS